MRRSILALLLLPVACGSPPPPATHIITPPPSSSAAPPAAASLSESCALTARPLPADTPAVWGSTAPSVWLTAHGNGLDAWFSSGSRGPYQHARLLQDGSLDARTDIAPFANLGEASDPVVASDGDLVALADTVYKTQQDADVMITFGAPGRWSKPITPLPGPELDTDPAVAFSGGLLAVAWRRGAYPMAPDLALAIVRRDGSVVDAGVALRDVQAEGIALVGVPSGWLLLYTPSSALEQSRHALIALAIDPSGRVVSRNVVSKSDALWPVAAWNGREVGVAYRDQAGERGVVSFARLGPDGRSLGGPVVADRHPDPLASFRPLSLVPDKAGWWLGDVAGFSASVMIARASEGRVVQLDANGQPKSSAVVSASAGASLVRLARSGAGVRGVFVDDRGGRLHAFDLACAAPAPQPPADACAARTASIAPDRFVPFRTLAESSIELAGNAVVGYRPIQRGPYGPTAGNVLVSRMSADGALAWTADLGAGYHPRLAAARSEVGVLVQTGSGAGQSLVVLDAARGAVVHKRATAVDAGSGCIAATPQGWLVVSGAPYNTPGGKPTSVTLADDGAPRDRRDLDDAVQDCALLPTSAGFLLAYTHPGPMSETSWLFVRELDARGQPRGAGVRVRDVSFATEPVLARRGSGPVLLFEDALGRNLHAVVLDGHGAARSAVIDVAQTYGLHAFLPWGDEIVWATDEGISRRGCLEKLLASPP